MYWELLTAQAKHDELVREAEAEHLANLAVQERREENKLYNPTLAWMGRRMVQLGSDLTRRYGVKSENTSSDN